MVDSIINRVLVSSTFNLNFNYFVTITIYIISYFFNINFFTFYFTIFYLIFFDCIFAEKIIMSIACQLIKGLTKAIYLSGPCFTSINLTIFSHPSLIRITKGMSIVPGMRWHTHILNKVQNVSNALKCSFVVLISICFYNSSFIIVILSRTVLIPGPLLSRPAA